MSNYVRDKVEYVRGPKIYRHMEPYKRSKVKLHGLKILDTPYSDEVNM